MKITAQEAQTLADKLAITIGLPAYEPATMTTAEDLAGVTGTSVGIAERELARQEKEGTLTRITVRIDGRRRYAYTETKKE